MYGNWMGEECKCDIHTSPQGQQGIYRYFEQGIKRQILINQYSAKHCIRVGLTKK